MADGRVTAVLDWPNVIVTDPEYDVASTRVILTAVPVSVLPVPAALRPVVGALRHVLHPPPQSGSPRASRGSVA